MVDWKYYPGNVKQINAILEDGVTLCIFEYVGEPVGEWDSNWKNDSYEYQHKTMRVETKEFRLPSSWIFNETIAMQGSLTYNITRTMDVRFTDSNMTGKLRPGSTNDRNTSHYRFRCPLGCNKILSSGVPYSKRDDTLWFTIGLYFKRCIDCKIKFYNCSCYEKSIKERYGHDFYNSNICLRCYNDKRFFVQRANHFQFLKCDIEVFVDKYFNRLKPWIIQRLEKNNGSKLRRSDRTTTLPYPSTFKQIKKQLLFCNPRSAQKIIKKKHVEEMCLSPPTLQQICIFNLVEQLLQKKVLDEDENAVKNILDVLPDDDVKNDLEMLYSFFEERAIKCQTHFFAGGRAGRKETPVNFNSFQHWRHPIYKRYHHSN
jgi:hypothetical protein